LPFWHGSGGVRPLSDIGSVNVKREQPESCSLFLEFHFDGGGGGS
jgi:hypothetical protein